MTIYRLNNSIQEYAWGSITDIPKLLGIGNPNRTPVAELWMGAHPKAPSLVTKDDGLQKLSDLIDLYPESILGAETVERFGPALPFLFKVLASEKALALQVHPNKEQAEKGFERENVRGIGLNAPHRNYLDRNHKPEMICALEPFWCLAGFRRIDRIVDELESLRLTTIDKEIDLFTRSQSTPELKLLFDSIMLMVDERKRLFVKEVVERAADSNADRYKWIVELNHQYPGDIGVVAPLFLNLFHLRAGQAVYLGAGLVHAYLRGFGIELMSNSDNVLRGGLSVRHIDIPEFVKILQYNESSVDPITPIEVEKGTDVYMTPTSDFCLSRIRLKKGLQYVSSQKRAVEILICIDGAAVLHYGDLPDEIVIHKGDSFLIPATGPAYSIEGEGLLFKATVPGRPAKDDKFDKKKC